MPMPERTDEEIARAVQEGSVYDFKELVKRYEEKMTRYARKFLFGAEDIQDLVQDVFVKSYINIQSFDTEKKFSSWMYRIAHNEFINALKKKGREKVFSFDFDVLFPHLVARETADEATNQKDMRETLNRSLDSIEVKYREPLVLYYFEELDYKEIAEILRVPVSTVGVRLKRGRALLKNIVRKTGEAYDA